jgi:nucleoside-diphosphate-sugar epimerase
VDGISLRFPTICVRPGKPNAAASGFFSGIIREPLNGLEAQLPVDDEVRHTHASPRSAVGFLLHAAGLDAQHVGNHRAITMPGVAATVGEQIAALRRIAGEQVANRIVRKPDLFIQQIVSGWPQRFDTRKALRLGFRSEQTFDEIIRYYIDDELGGTFQS